jgi:hypothetical protein
LTLAIQTDVRYNIVVVALPRAVVGGGFAGDPVARFSADLGGIAEQRIEELHGDVLGEDLVELYRIRDRLEAECCRRIRLFERRRGFTEGNAVSSIGWLRLHCRMSGAAAADRVEIARRLPELPSADAAFLAGDICYQNASTIAHTVAAVGTEAARSCEEVLVESARRFNPGHFRVVARHLRHCVDATAAQEEADLEHERRRLDVSPTLDGIVYIDGRLDAEDGAIVISALDSLSMPIPGDNRWASQRRADALVELARRQLDSGTLPQRGGQKPHVSLTVSIETLRRELGSPGGELSWTGPVSAESARRLACDAAVTEVVVDAQGMPLSVGRTRRTIPPAIRRALEIRDRGCCYPGCDRPPSWTDAHHLRHWVDGGETKLSNLGLLCRPHHTAVHAHDLVLKRGADGCFEIVEPAARVSGGTGSRGPGP